MQIRRLKWTAGAVVALGLVPVGCDNGSASSHPCPPGACCGSCCETPTTGTGAGKLPPRPSAPAASTTTPMVFAVSKMYFGDLDSAGHVSDTAWQTYGLDIDGKVTGESSTDVCTLVPGAPCEVRLDGDDGIDNSFGSNVLAAIDTIDDTYDSYANGVIQAGGGTLLIRIDGLGSADGYSQLPGALYRATPTSQTPKWDGTDVRPVDTASLVGGDVGKPVAALPNGYMNDRVWVSGISTGQAYLDLLVMAGNAGIGFLPPISLQHVQVAMRIAPGNASATSGVLSGVARAKDVAAWFQLWAGTISSSLCDGPAAESLTSQLEQMSDIMADGTNEPGKPCDGISVGIGFDAVAVHLGTAQTEAPVVSACGDAGLDAPSQ